MSRVITALGYVLDGVAAIALVLAARLQPERLASFGEMLDRVMASRAARITVILFWWWLGWHFLAMPPEDA